MYTNIERFHRIEDANNILETLGLDSSVLTNEEKLFVFSNNEYSLEEEKLKIIYNSYLIGLRKEKIIGRSTEPLIKKTNTFASYIGQTETSDDNAKEVYILSEIYNISKHTTDAHSLIEKFYRLNEGRETPMIYTTDEAKLEIQQCKEDYKLAQALQGKRSRVPVKTIVLG